jgi:hypothetical protein
MAVRGSPFHGDGFGEKDQFLWKTISVSCPYFCRENEAESESVDQLVEEGNPFETDVVAGVEYADNNEKKRSGHN